MTVCDLSSLCNYKSHVGLLDDVESKAATYNMSIKYFVPFGSQSLT